MEPELDKKTNAQENLEFFKKNKSKLLLTTFIFFSLLTIFFIFKEIQKKKDISLSEKYIKASLLISNGNNEAAKKHYEEIILSKNNFYSILSLNKIIEKELITEKEKILKFFEILEKSNSKNGDLDLIYLKKGLYLIKVKDFKNGTAILKRLVSENSKLKSIAEDILKD